MRYSWLLLVVLETAGIGATAQSSRPFNPRDVDALENEARDEWQMPAQVVEALEIEPGSIIADIGAGSGYFVPYLSEETGPTGKLFAVDIQQQMLAFVERKISELGLANVTTVLSHENDTRLEPSSVDLALLVDVYYELRTPKALMSNIREVLKPEGRLAIIDFHPDKDVPVGPPLRYRVPQERLIAEVEAVGLKLTQQHSFLPYQYFLIFARTDGTE